MTTIIQARRFVRTAPAAALSDAAGLAGICAVIFAGLVLPGVLL
ncbi:MAG: hypothetical protein AAFZ09_04525 [Pseudomonadota bacterium]